MVYTSAIVGVYTMAKLETLQVRALRKNLAVVIKAGSPVLVRRRSHNVALLIPLVDHYQGDSTAAAKETAKIRRMAREGKLDLS